MKISRFLVCIIKVFNIFNINEDIDKFSSILIQNICLFLLLILTCINFYILFFLGTFQFTSTNFRNKMEEQVFVNSFYIANNIVYIVFKIL
jgi:hypothetical protein